MCEGEVAHWSLLSDCFFLFVCLFCFVFFFSLFERFASSSTVVYKCMTASSVLGLNTALLNLLNLLFLRIIVILYSVAFCLLSGYYMTSHSD